MRPGDSGRAPVDAVARGDPLHSLGSLRIGVTHFKIAHKGVCRATRGDYYLGRPSPGSYRFGFWRSSRSRRDRSSMPPCSDSGMGPLLMFSQCSEINLSARLTNGTWLTAPTWKHFKVLVLSLD